MTVLHYACMPWDTEQQGGGVVMQMLAEELSVVVKAEVPHTAITTPADHEMCIEEDAFSIPFNEKGWPTDNGDRTVWDLRERRLMRATGGPYDGDLGVMAGKDEHGHYLVHFAKSLMPTFRDKPHMRMFAKPFTLRMGTWFVEGHCCAFCFI